MEVQNGRFFFAGIVLFSFASKNYNLLVCIFFRGVLAEGSGLRLITIRPQLVQNLCSLLLISAPISQMLKKLAICNFSKFPPADRGMHWEFSLKSMLPPFHTAQFKIICMRCISVLECTYFWNLRCCTGIHIFALNYIFSYSNMYFCTGTYNSVPEKNIYLY